MDNNKKVGLTVVIMSCICAVLGNTNLFVDIAYGHTNSESFVLHTICAIVYNICAIVWILRYCKSKKDNK